jgi:hypothetical protein
MEQTLFEIVEAMGTPLTIDVATQNKTFGHFACVLVDTNGFLMKFEWEGYAFKVDVVFERLPMFYSHCLIIRHH